MLISLLASTTLSCYSVGYHYDPSTKTEIYFNSRTGLTLGRYVDANRPEPNPRRRAKELGLCDDHAAA